MGTLSLQEIGNGANNEIRGVVFDFRSSMDHWNQEVNNLPPEKVIRDFNMYFFSGQYQENVTSVLALGVARLSEEQLENFQIY